MDEEFTQISIPILHGDVQLTKKFDIVLKKFDLLPLRDVVL